MTPVTREPLGGVLGPGGPSGMELEETLGCERAYYGVEIRKRSVGKSLTELQCERLVLIRVNPSFCFISCYEMLNMEQGTASASSRQPNFIRS